MLACLALAGSAVARGYSGHWFTWMLAGLGALIPLLWLLQGWLYRKTLRERLPHEPPFTTVQSRADALVIRAGENVVVLPWERLRKIERRPDHWLLFFSPGRDEFNVLPLRPLPVDMQTHILEQAQSAGCKVT